MMTVNKVKKLTGVSIRSLRHYDKIGVLKPTDYSKAGYRLYDDTAIEKVQQILLLRELEFTLLDIKEILESPGYNWDSVIEHQISFLTMKKERLEKLIDFARRIKSGEDNTMDFSIFDSTKLEEYKKRAKEQWEDLPEYQEYEERAKNRTKVEEQDVIKSFMNLFTEFGRLRVLNPENRRVQEHVKKLQCYITATFYNCTDEILSKLGQMYAADGEFKDNIDRAGGTGTAEYTAEAIRIYCSK